MSLRTLLGEPTFGRVKPPTPPMPYTQLAVSLERRAISGTAGGYFDWRRVEITIHGVKADVVRALAQVASVFNNNLGRPGAPYTLTFPSAAAGTRFLAWLADRQPTLEEDDATFQGKDVWRGTISGLVWTWRAQ